MSFKDIFSWLGSYDVQEQVEGARSVCGGPLKDTGGGVVSRRALGKLWRVACKKAQVARMLARTHIRTRTLAHVRARAHTYIHAHAHARTNTHTHTHTQTHTHTCTHTHTYTHADTHFVIQGRLELVIDI